MIEYFKERFILDFQFLADYWWAYILIVVGVIVVSLIRK